jgi:uncharacterized protein (TIGR02466 family)
MENNLNILDPWSPLVLQDNFLDYDWPTIKDKCDAIIDTTHQNSYLEMDGGVSSVASVNAPPHTWIEFNNLHEWMHSRIREVVRRWHLTDQPYRIGKSWVNRHAPGAWTDEHTHRGIQITVVFYLHVPENSGRIMFKDPLEYHWSGQPSDWRHYENDGWYPVEIKTGDLVVFPGWLPHKTEVNNSKEDRYVMSMNLIGQVPMKDLEIK